MTVEEKRGSPDKFPVGLRVLAVDDDRSCLKLLEKLLRQCQYHVTTTHQARIALKLLREKRDKFDLVISDVHMPDMDGFKLLELVGLEMDLPVIMLSANSDPKAVMQGITHGACDYLLKPVRIEELKNIWQHVIRRKKFDAIKDVNTFDNIDNCDKSNQGNPDVGDGSAVTGSSDRNGKMSRKRKDQNEDEDYDCEEGHENDDPSMQKKPRVVWSVELHRKFVAAVNQLGIDKAMPKRILDLMNVDKLTRENVASHLQKYRLYLKRISNVANHPQANVVAALGAKDSSYFQAGTLDDVRNYHAFAGSGSMSTLASFQQSAMLGRLNSPMGSGLYSLASPRMIQLGHGQNNSGNLIHDNGKPSSISFSGTTAPNWLQGLPTSLGLDQFQQHKAVFEPSNHPLSASLPSGNSNNSFINPINNNQLHEQHQQVRSNGFGGHSSATPDPFDISSNAASYLPDLHGRNDSLAAGASTLTGYATDTLPLSVPCAHEALPSTNLRECFSPVSANMEGNLCAVPSGRTTISPMPDSIMGRDFQCQLQSNNEIGFADVGSIGNSRQRLEGLNQDQIHRTNINYDSCPVLPSHDSMNDGTQSPGFVNGIPTRAFDMTASQACFNAPIYKQNYGFERTSNDQSHPEATKLQGVCNPTGYNPFDDLIGAIVKQERQDTLMDGDIGCDIYSLGTCM